MTFIATLSNLRTSFIFFWKVRSLPKTNDLNYMNLSPPKPKKRRKKNHPISTKKTKTPTEKNTGQVLNPNFGDLQQLLQCCGKSAAFASEIATLVNTNAITGDIEKTIRERYVGNGKCEDPGLGSLMAKGNPTCSLVT